MYVPSCKENDIITDIDEVGKDDLLALEHQCEILEVIRDNRRTEFEHIRTSLHELKSLLHEKEKRDVPA